MSKKINKKLLELIGNETDPAKIVRIVNRYNEAKAAEQVRANRRRQFLKEAGVDTKKVNIETIAEYTFEFTYSKVAEFRNWFKLNHEELTEGYVSPKKAKAQIIEIKEHNEA